MVQDRGGIMVYCRERDELKELAMIASTLNSGFLMLLRDLRFLLEITQLKYANSVCYQIN